MGPDVFISHSTPDARVAETLCAELESAGVSCWMARRDLRGGTRWARDIAAVIRRAPVFVVVVSPDAVESPHVFNEITLATNAGAAIVPIRTGDEPVPDEFAYHLEASHYLDARHGVSPHVAAIKAIAGAAREQRAQGAGRSRPRATTQSMAASSPGAPRPARARRVLPRAAVVGLLLLVPAAGWLVVNRRQDQQRAAALASPGDEAELAPARMTVATAAGIALSVSPGTGWVRDGAENGRQISLRHRVADLRFLAGIDAETLASPATFARGWLRRYGGALPGPVVAGSPVPVGSAEWDVPLFATTPADTSREAAGVLRVTRFAADGYDLVRWWAAAGPAPGTIGPHEGDVRALIESMIPGAGAARAAGPR